MGDSTASKVQRQQPAAKARQLADASRQGPSISPAGGVLALQHAAGNRAVSRLLHSNERVSSPNDPDEVRADHLAARLIGNKSNNQRRVSRIPRLGGSAGQKLLHAELAFLEARLNMDLSGVRLHTDSQAAGMADKYDAQAFTIGSDIFFNRGQFVPQTRSGLHLIAHELAHALYPSAGIQRKAKRSNAAKPPSETPEVLARKLRESFRGLGTDEAEVYRVLSFPPATARAVYDYYNKNLNDHTGHGLMADIEDEMSGDELKRAMQLITSAGIKEPAPILAKRLREAFRGLGTDEDTVYRVLSQPPAVIREIINYYNDHYNDHTGQGMVEDIRDEMSGSELEKALKLLDRAGIDAHTTFRRKAVPTKVAGDPSKVWVGIIVRGKWSGEHHPGVMEQHADVVVPNAADKGQTVGYFGEQNAPGAGSTSGAGASVGLDIPGVSADWAWFMANRRAYIDLELAKLVKLWSGLILIKATKAQAATLSKYWKDLQGDPGTFYILGKNCSTAAAAGFEKAGITKEISGLDTPDHLYAQLREEYPDAYMISGFYGYTRAGLKWRKVGDNVQLDNPGTGAWKGPYVEEPRLT